MHKSSDSGFSLIETVIASGVLAVGMLGAAAVFSHGMQKVTSAPGDLIATQKASEAIESVFSARDSHTLAWAQLRNVNGASGADGGIFLDGPRGLTTAGPDGLVNTADDGQVETITTPGPDQIYGTADDQVIPLGQYTREIRIRDVELDLRSITVTITYLVGPETRRYTLTTYISNYS
jgi:prepilin-type N-terminal cleavage/methylation domain-containing protein